VVDPLLHVVQAGEKLALLGGVVRDRVEAGENREEADV
jgi:hypothetical protein